MSDDAGDLRFRIAEMLIGGMKCSHVPMRLALEAQGRDDADLVRAMSGLAYGLGQGFACGMLTSGACVVGLVAGRASEAEVDDPRFAAALDAFTGWFHTMARERYGGIACSDIMRFDERLKAERCPALIQEVWEKLVETLEDHGLDVSRPAGTETEDPT
jgi:hypothetical protein